MTEAVVHELVTVTEDEAGRLEEEFLNGLDQAQDAFVRIMETNAWAALGYDSFAAWWEQRVVPVMRALSMRPTREIVDRVLEQVRQEEVALPPAQRRTQHELAELAGTSEWTVAGRTKPIQDRSQPRVSPVADLGSRAEPPSVGPQPSQPVEGRTPGLVDGGGANLAAIDEAEDAPAPDAGASETRSALDRLNGLGPDQISGVLASGLADEPNGLSSGPTEAQGKPGGSRRKPITDAFRDAVYDLRKVVERVERIVLDDRWPKNAKKVDPGSRNDLQRALDLLAAVVEQANK